MDFASFDAQVRKVSELILGDKFQPDLIVGVARGGWIPARLLSKYLNVKKLSSYGIAYTDSTRTTTETYQAVLPSPDISKILVVEDFLESGKSIKHVIKELAAKGIDVRSAAVGYLEKTNLIPTYSLGCVKEIPQFPWD